MSHFLYIQITKLSLNILSKIFLILWNKQIHKNNFHFLWTLKSSVHRHKNKGVPFWVYGKSSKGKITSWSLSRLSTKPGQMQGFLRMRLGFWESEECLQRSGGTFTEICVFVCWRSKLNEQQQLKSMKYCCNCRQEHNDAIINKPVEPIVLLKVLDGRMTHCYLYTQVRSINDITMSLCVTRSPPGSCHISNKIGLIWTLKSRLIRLRQSYEGQMLDKLLGLGNTTVCTHLYLSLLIWQYWIDGINVTSYLCLSGIFLIGLAIIDQDYFIF